MQKRIVQAASEDFHAAISVASYPMGPPPHFPALIILHVSLRIGCLSGGGLEESD